MTASGPPAFERVRVICVRNGTVLLVQHRSADGSPFWLFPGGGIKSGESIEATAVREVWEEAGVRIRVIRALAPPEAIATAWSTHAFVLAEPLDEETLGPQPAPDGDAVFAVEWHAVTEERPIAGLQPEYWSGLDDFLPRTVRSMNAVEGAEIP